MAHILVVDDHDSVRETLSDQLLAFGHTVEVAGDAPQGMERLQDAEFDLIITDYKMPGMSGAEFLRSIHADVHRKTPCMLITAWADVQYAVEAMQAGACNFIVKPWDMGYLRASVERALELRAHYRMQLEYERELERRLEEARREVRSTYEGTVSGIAAMLEGKDTSTVQHCQRVADYCTVLALELGVAHERLHDIRIGALLHDIGKYKVPDRILLKPGPLTEEEWVEMRRHPTYGGEFVERVPFLQGAREIIENHHERWDGTGYPRGLAGEQIPLAARIFFVCDAYDAITSRRCYKPALPAEHAVAEIRRCSGTQFDPRVVEAFERTLHRFLEIAARTPDDAPFVGNYVEPFVDRVASLPVAPALNGHRTLNGYAR